MHVNIRQLRALDAIVRLGSFVEAARALHVTPAALSLAVRELEERLGFTVLERTTRSVRLSEAGRGYLPFVQRVLAELEDADRYASEVQQGHGLVRVATTQTIIGALLPPVLREVHARWPNVRVHPLDVATISIPDAIRSRQADLAIGVRFENDEALDVRPFFTSSWYAFVARTHPLGARRRMDWKSLRGHRLFMNKSSHLSLQVALGTVAPFDDVQDIATAISGLAMASTGLGVGVFPAYVHPFASISGMVGLQLGAPVVPHHLLIAAARQPATSAPLNAIRDLMVEAMRKHGAPLARPAQRTASAR